MHPQIFHNKRVTLIMYIHNLMIKDQKSILFSLGKRGQNNLSTDPFLSQVLGNFLGKETRWMM